MYESDQCRLVGNGINVIAAFNVQHLESLNHMVRRISGVEIRETVPDAFLNGADQIVSVDISVAELRQRLREGKIYPPEQVEQALKNFFKPRTLAALSELALQTERDHVKGIFNSTGSVTAAEAVVDHAYGRPSGAVGAAMSPTAIHTPSDGSSHRTDAT
jgi:K+-sensing histidine kinase KdpD